MDVTKIAGLMGAAAIAAGAFGAHGLKGAGTDPKLVAAWETAAHYQLMHSIALLMIPKAKLGTWTPTLFIAGTLLFSGSIYFMVGTGIKKAGMITPIGGTTLIFAWLSLAI